ncbi:MAG: ATP-dependent RNA helicase HrpA [Planctomycetota bacterium]|nr:MAG: ATP-dependent RNA helicase HrpA [Planctomycetota bacterium]
MYDDLPGWEDLPSQILCRALDTRERIRQREARGQASERLRARLQQLLDEGRQSLAHQPAASWRLDYPADLPVSGARETIIEQLRQRSCLVLTGETGSGKTTQLPKMLVEAGYGRRGMIAITQPRRLAAVSVARRLAEECGCDDGSIAHAVRFDDQRQDHSRLVVMTDGLLLAELSRDPWLSRYDAVLVDEAHERSTTIDCLLAGLLRLRRRRPDLALAVTSATIDVEIMADYLADGGPRAPIIQVDGRLYPVEQRSWLLNSERDAGGYLDALVDCVRHIHAGNQHPGDILCFLPTERDILEARRRLLDLQGATILPCFGRLNSHEQQRIFSQVSGRKIVLATPIAETSLTVPGIGVVVDSGLARMKRYRAQARTERLPIEAVSQASLRQRRGRAGRLGPGVCYELFTSSDAASRPAFTEPEILRSNLSGVLLQLLASGERDPQALPWLTPPRPQDWEQAWQGLDELGAIDGERRLTELGRRMSRLPLDPGLARICLAGIEAGIGSDALTIAAFLSIQDPRLRPQGEEAKADAEHRRFQHPESDLITVLQLWDAWKAEPSNTARVRFARAHYLSWLRMREWSDVRRQMAKELRNLGLAQLPEGGEARIERSQNRIDTLHHCVLAGMLGMVMRREIPSPEPTSRKQAQTGKSERPGRAPPIYRGAGNRPLRLHPSSVLAMRASRKAAATPAAEWLVACEIIETSQVWARLCAPIQRDALIALIGDRGKRSASAPIWEAERARVVVYEQLTWLGLAVIERQAVAAERVVGREAAEAVFIEQALVAGGIRQAPAILQANAQAIADADGAALRLRDRSLRIDPEAIAETYRQRLAGLPQRRPDCTSLVALKRLLRQYDEDWLRLRPIDCCHRWWEAEGLFPRQVSLAAGLTLAVSYRHQPGDDDDGATIRIPQDQLDRLELWRCERVLPGLVAWSIEEWHRGLPARWREELPLSQERLWEWSEELLASTCDLATAMRQILARHQGPDSVIPSLARLPDWCRLRLQICAEDGRILESSRDPQSLLSANPESQDSLAALRAQIESAPSQDWPGDIPERVGRGSQVASAALVRARNQNAEVAVRVALFSTPECAQHWHRDGVQAWLEASLDADLSALAKECAGPLGNHAGGPGPAILRGAAMALVAAELGEEALHSCRQRACAQPLAAKATSLLERERPQLADWARRLGHSSQQLQGRLRRGARGLAGLAAMQDLQRQSNLLLGQNWWLTLPWWGLQALPDWLEAVLNAHPPSPRQERERRRVSRLVDDWQEFRRDVDLPPARALGLAEDWQQAHAMAWECYWAALGASSPRHQAHELRVRSFMEEARGRLSASLSAWQMLAQEMRGLLPMIERLNGPVAQRVAAAGHEVLRRGLDLGFAADPPAQRQHMQHWLQQARQLV